MSETRNYRAIAAQRLEDLATKQQAIDELALKVRDLEEELDESDHALKTMSKSLLELQGQSDLWEKQCGAFAKSLASSERVILEVASERDAYFRILKRCYWFFVNIRQEGGVPVLPLDKNELKQLLEEVTNG